MQLDFISDPTLDDAREMQAFAEVEARGAIFTKRPVVEFILDLVGYRSSESLSKGRILEPSFGDGDFLIPMVDRLLASLPNKAAEFDLQALSNCIRAVEIHKPTFDATRGRLVRHLMSHGLSEDASISLCDAWLVRDDFLLTEQIDSGFDFVAGNPPYVRQELVPDALMKEYRRRYATIFDRADIYIPFFERSLRALRQDGRLGFICADRWTKNRYGGPLRAMIADGYALSHHIDMTGIDAFESEVDAYPAVTVVERATKASPTLVVRMAGADVSELPNLTKQFDSGDTQPFEVVEVPNVAVDANPWLLDSPLRLALVRRLEAEFPCLEDAGCKVGIGVATGADKIFIGQFDALPVEDSRKLPLSMRRDLKDGRVDWHGRGVVNPFDDDGRLVNLSDYPLLAAYLTANREALLKRNVAKRTPSRWYRTIDRIHNDLTAKPKLLIPDIAGEAKIAFDAGGFYPHHNLYFVTSDEWDLYALRAVLQCEVTRLFIECYSTRMRGGYVRYQAQYLRRLRLPRWNGLSAKLQQDLHRAGQMDSPPGGEDLIAQLYNLTGTDMETLSQDAEAVR